MTAELEKRVQVLESCVGGLLEALIAIRQDSGELRSMVEHIKSSTDMISELLHRTQHHLRPARW